MRFRPITVGLLLVLACSALVSQGKAEQPSDEKPLQGFADAVQRVPKVEKSTINKRFADDFSLPSQPDDLWMYQISLTQQPDGDQRTVFVRPRANAGTDIFFIVVNRKIRQGWFYYTSPSGRLIRATRTDDNGIHQLAPDDAKVPFEKEKTFWLDWIRNAKDAGSATESKPAEDQK